MYFSSIFPYVVLICFLVRGLLLDGSLEGIAYMFYPKVGAHNVWSNVKTKRMKLNVESCFFSEL